MKACFIGLGSIGTRHCLNLTQICKEQDLSLKIHALRATDKPLRESLSGITITPLRSYDEMDEDYDAIFLTNPTSLHYETLRRVCGKARCFFIEKPVFERTNEDIEDLPLRKDAICYVAAPLRYTGVLREAQKVTAAHRVYSARAISSSYLPDWRPGIDYRETYSAHREMGGGVSIDLIHEWDYLTMLFGFPNRIYSIIGKYSDLEIDSDDLAAYIAAYDDKTIEVHLDYFGKKTQRYLELLTDVGTYLFDIANATVHFPDGKELRLTESVNGRYLEEMRSFLRLVNGTCRISGNSIEHAVRVLKLTKGLNSQ